MTNTLALYNRFTNIPFGSFLFSTGGYVSVPRLIRRFIQM